MNFHVLSGYGAVASISGNPASSLDISEACEAASLTKFIESQKDGYETVFNLCINVYLL